MTDFDTTQTMVVLEDTPLMATAMQTAVATLYPDANVVVQADPRTINTWFDRQPHGSVALIVVDRNLKINVLNIELDGFTFIRSIRSHKAMAPKAKVIVWTSDDSAASIFAARHSGAHAFLSKNRSIHSDLEADLYTVLMACDDGPSWQVLT